MGRFLKRRQRSQSVKNHEKQNYLFKEMLTFHHLLTNFLQTYNKLCDNFRKQYAAGITLRQLDVHLSPFTIFGQKKNEINISINKKKAYEKIYSITPCT